MELIMKNQSSGNGRGSSEVQAMTNPSSKKTSGKGHAADSSKGKTAVAAKATGPSGVTGTMIPASAKGGHH
jgi:hypothetical protein